MVQSPPRVEAIPVAAAAVVVPEPLVSAAQATVVDTATAVALPEVAPFKLPMAELIQVAERSGLQWVSSDADKIAAVQAAIAAEPARVRIPRERPSIMVSDEGPLVLVETKKDLRNLNLPF
jgi:ribonuclease E